MSEIKPRQYFKPEDFALLPPSIFNDYNKTFDYRACVAQSANEKLAPVLKMMNEMADALKGAEHMFKAIQEDTVSERGTGCDSKCNGWGHSNECYLSELIYDEEVEDVSTSIKSYKSFLAQIEKEK